jgi:cyclase
VKKRIILGLLFDGSHFYLSRNFRLQKLGDLDWLQLNFQIFDLASHVDEIAVFHVRRTMGCQDFGLALQQLTSRIFVPVSVGGGLHTMQEVDTMFRSGADRIMFSNSIWTQPELIRATSQKYGAQATVGVINFEKDSSAGASLKKSGGQPLAVEGFEETTRSVSRLALGEIVLQSVERDGTGQGFPVEELDSFTPLSKVPWIAAGGFGSVVHLAETLLDDRIHGVLTSNLLAFLGNGLEIARSRASDGGVEMAKWESLAELGAG